MSGDTGAGVNAFGVEAISVRCFGESAVSQICRKEKSARAKVLGTLRAMVGSADDADSHESEEGKLVGQTFDF